MAQQNRDAQDLAAKEEAAGKLSEAFERALQRFKVADADPKQAANEWLVHRGKITDLAKSQHFSVLATFVSKAQNIDPLVSWEQLARQVDLVSFSKNITELFEIKTFIDGKNSPFKQALKSLGSLSVDDRTTLANSANTASELIVATFQARMLELSAAEEAEKLKSEQVDLTLPAAPERRGRVHPTLQVMDEMTAIFAEMGFALAEGPDIEDDFHNFTALNFPPKHPAREMHDTFWLAPDETGERKVLRTHTSPVQVRVLRGGEEKLPSWIANGEAPPIRVIVPGRVYRSDSDATHTPMFHQMEGLVIDRAIHMGHLKWTLETFARRFFEAEGVVTRFRPHHFPFTEPSCEMDVQCDRSGGEVRIGQGSDWLEILGGGMVHPNVLRNCGLDPDEWQGFAFGMGVDRLGMLKYGMPDLRDMFAADVRWLAHYGFSAFQAPNPATGLS